MRDEFPAVVQPTSLGPSLLVIQMKDKRRLRAQQFDIRNRRLSFIWITSRDGPKLVGCTTVGNSSRISRSWMAPGIPAFQRACANSSALDRLKGRIWVDLATGASTGCETTLNTSTFLKTPPRQSCLAGFSLRSPI